MSKFGLIFLLVSMFSMSGELQTVNIPDVTGLEESVAVEMLEEMELSDGSKIEVVKEYAYSDTMEKDIVYKQSPVGDVTEEEAKKVTITISMGPEPTENVDSSEEGGSKINSFGIAGYLDNTATTATSRFGVDWESVPKSYEYSWDNSIMCWIFGVNINGTRYRTSWGTYDTNVRHMVQVYCDGKYVYTRIVLARANGNTVNGTGFTYSLDDQSVTFEVRGPNGKALSNESKKLGAGTYQVIVRHSSGAVSGETVNGASGYLTINDTGINPELEIKIPLSEASYQNTNIDLDAFGTITFQNSNLMYRTTTSSGADTLPFLAAAVFLVLIPVSTYFLKKHGQKRNVDEQKV